MVKEKQLHERTNVLMIIGTIIVVVCIIGAILFVVIDDLIHKNRR